MLSEKKHLVRELLTMTKMVGIYCAAQHGSHDDTLCKECEQFLEYATVRLEKCPYGDEKPTCSNCPIHCYKPAQKAHASEIMRFAGPRMMFHHPILAIRHKLDGFRKVGHPKELKREDRLNSRDK